MRFVRGHHVDFETALAQRGGKSVARDEGTQHQNAWRAAGAARGKGGDDGVGQALAAELLRYHFRHQAAPAQRGFGAGANRGHHGTTEGARIEPFGKKGVERSLDAVGAGECDQIVGGERSQGRGKRGGGRVDRSALRVQRTDRTHFSTVSVEPIRLQKFIAEAGVCSRRAAEALIAQGEVWVNGAEQPRGLGAIAKTLSMDMRSEDRAWLKLKLEALAKARDEQGFALKMPGELEPRWQSGVVSAFANIVSWRCEQLGVFQDPSQQLVPLPTPVMNALFSRKEPKAGPLGTMSWTVDVTNANTGDDFVLGVKELHLPDGSRRPYSIWLAGEYPKALDGLCKLISLDMRVVDANWIGLKLKKLLNFGEQNGEFWAPVPGEEKSSLYPSTVAYIATLLLHRYKVLGILDDEGRAIQSAGILALPDAVKVIENETAPVKGKVCPSCHAAAMIKRDGCEFCTACGYTGQCS